MELADFNVGDEFRCGNGEYRCTDIGARTVIAIRLDHIEISGTTPRTLNRIQAEADGWFSGPPYAVVEYVFDEESRKGCHASYPLLKDREMN